LPGTRSLSGPRGQCVGSAMRPKLSHNLPRVPPKLSQSKGASRMPIESNPGSDRRAHALQQSVLGGSCQAVHGHFRAHVGSVWVRAWDPNDPTTCLGPPKSCPKAEGLVECQSKAPQGRTGGPTPSNKVCWGWSSYSAVPVPGPGTHFHGARTQPRWSPYPYPCGRAYIGVVPVLTPGGSRSHRWFRAQPGWFSCCQVGTHIAIPVVTPCKP
jgi:hypothetical protein